MIDMGFKVKLGPLRYQNQEIYYRARNDYRVWKWCRQFDLLNESQHESWLLSVQNDSKIRMYEVLAKVKEDVDPFSPVGVCGLTDIDHVNQRAEFSLYIFPEHHQHGYGVEALSCLLSHGFSNLNLNRIWGETFEGNPAAKIFEDLGFRREGERKEFYFREGKFIDAHLYSIGRKEWSKRD